VGDRQVQAARQLLPSGARRPAAVIAACSLAVTVVLGVLTAHSSRPDALDGTVDSWVQRTFGVHHGTMLLLEDVGKPAEVVVLTLVIVLACLATRRVNGAALTAVSVAVSVVLTEFVLKPVVGRTLGGYLVYPSGHTGFAFTLATVIVVLMLNPPRRQLRRTVKGVVAAGVALIGSAVAVAMIGLHAHYFTDTVGGAALAIGVVLTTTFLLDTERLRRQMRTAGPGRRPAPGMRVTGPSVPHRSEPASGAGQVHNR
jgi:membrane-associated phospholipid phosphatase